MKYIPFLIRSILIAANGSICGAQSTNSSSIPMEIAGIWITTKQDNLQSNSGGEMLTETKKAALCSSLRKNLYAKHSYEGVLILQGNKMISWDGACSVYGGFKITGDKYETRWSCEGEHGRNGGRVIFQLQKKNDQTLLIDTTTFKRGGSLTNVYDEKCA
jgi:hypothetical protein